MSIIAKPDSPKDWKIEVIDELIKYIDIESENFDFKKDVKGLAEHLCAMANTRGGFIVLGIDSKKSEDGRKVIRFDKIGFENKEQDTIKNGIINQASRIEPTPIIDIENVLDQKINKFFPVIKITGRIIDKPYFVKEINQCFIRLNATKYTADRHVILNLYGASFMQLQNLEKLRSSAILLKDEFLQTLDYDRHIHPMNASNAVPIDYGFMRDVILSNASFLRESGLMNSQEGLIHMLHVLSKFNIQVAGYNRADTYEERREFQMEYDDNTSYVLSLELARIKPLLESVIKICDETLKKYH